jgi:hypothetical protein
MAVLFEADRPKRCTLMECFGFPTRDRHMMSAVGDALVRKRSRPLWIAFVLLVSLWVAFEWWARPDCDHSRPGMRGERWVRPDGSVRYFDGTCWSDKVVPPMDMPF